MSTYTSGSFTATFTFSETVNNFVVGDVTVGNGAASVFSEDADNAGMVWTATILQWLRTSRTVWATR